jgi:hypothetical protein
MKPLWRHLNYANVVATFALLFAMSGGALAASHYLINSTSQINPKVIKKLKTDTGGPGSSGPNGSNGANGANGLQGKDGVQGPAGPEGPKGPEGAKGAEGAKGPQGNLATTLPSGQSESGDYGIGAPVPGKGSLSQAVSFPVPLAARIPASNIVFVLETETSLSHCSGVGHADPGFLCVYEQESVDIGGSGAAFGEYENHPGPHDGSGNYGFLITVPVTGAGENASEYGTYTVTAP